MDAGSGLAAGSFGTEGGAAGQKSCVWVGCVCMSCLGSATLAGHSVPWSRRGVRAWLDCHVEGLFQPVHSVNSVNSTAAALCHQGLSPIRSSVCPRFGWTLLSHCGVLFQFIFLLQA